jgi:hypothetical protein
LQQLDATIGIDHHRHHFPTQRVARLAVRLENVALSVERQHQILGELAFVMNHADPREFEGIARVGEMGVCLGFGQDGEAGIVVSQIAR